MKEGRKGKGHEGWGRQEVVKRRRRKEGKEKKGARKGKKEK